MIRAPARLRLALGSTLWALALAPRAGGEYAGDGAVSPAARLDAPDAAEGARETRRVLDLGPTEAQRASSSPEMEAAFAARADEELVAADFHLALSRTDRDAGAAPAIEVAVNDEPIALLRPEQVARGGSLDVPVDPRLLAPRNRVSVRMLHPGGGCGTGAWRRVEAMRMTLRSAPVALPDDLALLPLPFLDRGFDASATVAIVLGGAPTPERVRVAALVASWLALESPVPVRFEGHAGALPDGRAVVLVDGPGAAARLGIAPLPGPAVRMTDHPRHPASNAKLVVVGGRDPGELRAAAERLAGGVRLAGSEVRLAAAEPAAPALPYSAPRWMPPGRVVPFSELPGTAVLAHEGTDPATLSHRFRVAPDLWIWPADFVVLDLGWSERIPDGAPVPRLDVELNGEFLATLPRAAGAGEHVHRARLRIPREHVRGYDELLVHVRYPEHDPCAGGDEPEEPPRVELAGDSVLHLEALPHFAPQPDVALFAYDGWPFTRLPDLSETVVVLPEEPSGAELSLVLSVAGRLAQVTGRAGTGATFVAGARASDEELAGRDLLVIGADGDNPLLSRWGGRFPIAFEWGGARVRRPDVRRANLDLLGGAGPLLDLRRAERILAAAREVSAIAGIESPLTEGRTVIAVTATASDAFPPFGEFLGYAESRGRSGDLLVLSSGQRFLFRIGPAFPRGHLPPWTRFRWFLAGHWLVLVPAVAASAAALAAVLRRILAARMSERLAEGDAR